MIRHEIMAEVPNGDTGRVAQFLYVNDGTHKELKITDVQSDGNVRGVVHLRITDEVADELVNFFDGVNVYG